jgi:hypothetical protein
MSDHGIVVEVDAGYHDRENCVVYAPCGCEPGCECGHAVHEVDASGELGEALAAQCVMMDCGGGEECLSAWIVPQLAAGEKKRYAICAGEREPAEARGVEIELAEGQSATFKIGGEVFTRYNFSEEFARPNAYPVYGPGGVEVTEYAETDHPHHRSIYVALGEVNGHDNWSEMEGHAFIRNQSVEVLAEGPIFGQLKAVNDWVNPKGSKFMEDHTVITVYNTPDTGRLIDWDITLAATECGIHIGDTKEAGTLSVRMNTPLHERHGGTIVNAYGGLHEAENWGKPSPWVDYFGEVEGTRCGLAIFDSPHNLRHPTTWHVRSYGLFTANCWGYSYFTGDESKRGDYVMAQGECVRFVYRVYIHAGDNCEGKVGERYFDFAFPPKVSAVEG